MHPSASPHQMLLIWYPRRKICMGTRKYRNGWSSLLQKLQGMSNDKYGKPSLLDKVLARFHTTVVFVFHRPINCNRAYAVPNRPRILQNDVSHGCEDPKGSVRVENDHGPDQKGLVLPLRIVQLLACHWLAKNLEQGLFQWVYLWLLWLAVWR